MVPAEKPFDRHFLWFLSKRQRMLYFNHRRQISVNSGQVSHEKHWTFGLDFQARMRVIRPAPQFLIESPRKLREGQPGSTARSWSTAGCGSHRDATAVASRAWRAGGPKAADVRSQFRRRLRGRRCATARAARPIEEHNVAADLSRQISPTRYRSPSSGIRGCVYSIAL